MKENIFIANDTIQVNILFIAMYVNNVIRFERGLYNLGNSLGSEGSKPNYDRCNERIVRL